MKILIAYDGSPCADAALDDLTHAGLPDTGEALVVSVAEVWLPPPPPSAYEIVGLANTARTPVALERKYMSGSTVVEGAERLAANAAARFKTNFPNWTVEHEGTWGSPTWELFSRVKEFEADLLVVGSHGRSALGRLLLGSISQWLLHEAKCSVRVARGIIDEPDMPVRLVVGIDGSAPAKAALEEVMARKWPALSEVVVLVADEPLSPTMVGDVIPIVRLSVEEANEQERRHAVKLANAAAKRLQRGGLRARAEVRIGNPKKVLVDFAEEWRADCIFVGATGANGLLEHFLLGSVAAAVAARAHCSVEVVRRKRARRRPRKNGNGTSEV